MFDDVEPSSGPGDATNRSVLSVPMQRTSTFTRRRTASALGAWAAILVGVVALGMIGNRPAMSDTSPSVIQATARPTLSMFTARRVTIQRPDSHRALGEDGLMGGIVFGTNVPKLTQADIERDGYRYYAQFLPVDLNLEDHRPR